MTTVAEAEEALADIGIEARGPESTRWHPEGLNKHGGGLIQPASRSREGAMDRLSGLRARWPDLTWSVVRIETWEHRCIEEEAPNTDHAPPMNCDAHTTRSIG